MRAGGYTVHQSLTAEAAAVVKMSLALARRRGHAQVTPLHVAFTLLTGSSSPSPAHHQQLAFSSSYAHGLLRRACVKSHALQCRALELCFNVALNRLPTTDAGCSPPSSLSASIIHQFNNPTLSNALVAALKRAQANQRRGCIELQSQLPPPPPTEQHMQQQPLVAIKVELDQLVVSILDDPSVSRVMREAGFSSAAVKSNIEEESASMLAHHHHSSSSASIALVRPHFFNEPHIDFPTNGGGFGTSWPAPFLNQAPDSVGPSCKEEDVRAILEAMMRKQGRRRRANPVVVGDTASVAEASVGELMRRLDRGEVPGELRGAHVLRIHHQPRLSMARADVDASVADLRRRSADATAGVIIYVGDIRWAVDEADNAGLAEYMAAELARLQGELMAAQSGRAWLVAAASYKTYMRCRGSPLEAAWELQPVVVPAGAGNGLALGPRAAPPIPVPSMKQGQINRVAEVPVWDHASGEEDCVPTLCAECANSYEKEASAVRAKAQDITLALTYFPGWPRADEPQASDEDELLGLKMKWSRSCQQMLHLRGHQPLNIPTNASPSPWWCASLPNNQNKPRTEPKPSFAELSLSLHAPGAVHGASNSSNQGVKTTLSLLLPDSSEDLNTEPAGQESRAVVCSGEVDSNRLSWYGVSELPFGYPKREAEGALVPSSGESKRRRHGSGGLDLNLCADEEENTGDREEDHRPVPSNLTQECESYGEAGHRTSSDESHE